VYRWVDHTAELELEIEAPGEREVFADALTALAGLLGAAGEGSATRAVAVTAPDRPALLAGWLEELVFLAESEGFVATGIEQLTLRADSLDALVHGAPAEPPPLVKAVTYHGLRFERAGEGYVARVVLDV
jgi:SHS2 domain-containing protein